MDSIKDTIKEAAKKKAMSINSLAEQMNMTNQGLYKAFRDKTLKISQIERICEILEIHISDIFPKKIENTNIAGEKIVSYGSRVDNNNFFSGNEGELIRLQTENEQLKTFIDKQEKEIEFLRELVSRT